MALMMMELLDALQVLMKTTGRWLRTGKNRERRQGLYSPYCETASLRAMAWAWRMASRELL